MATTKKSSAAAPKKAKPVKPVVEKKPVKVKAAPQKPLAEKSTEHMIVENFIALTQVVESLSETLEVLVQKAESMAYHIIANEQMLAEIVAETGVNLARVNARIRLKIASGTDGIGNSSRAIDVAAAIASPLPRR